MDKKAQAYICSGCGIGAGADIAALSGMVEKEMKMPCSTHEILCSKSGRELIEGDIANGVNTIVIGACSLRVMQDEFNFGKDNIVVRANLREQGVWCQGDDPDAEYVQELLSDNMRMACVKAKKEELPEPFQLDAINKDILVMGGGIAGLTAAKEAASAGYNVTLVERTSQLGGKALGWRKQFPTKAPWSDLENPTIATLVKEVESDSKITVNTETEVARIGGAPGAFKVTLKPAGTTTEWDAPAKVTVDQQDAISKGQMADPNVGKQAYTAENPEALTYGAVVLATGWSPADVSSYAHLGYGQHKNVVTNAEFEKLAKTGKVPAKVAFVQSPGAAESDSDFPFCNSVTSMVALKQARYVREDNPNGVAYILYQHMRTPGNMEMFYKGAQNDDGIMLTKATVNQVESSGAGLKVTATNTLLNEDIELDVDMVVLAAGMVPATKHEDSINLAYRQGPAFLDLDLFDGYADSHFICFPYETRRTGVYTCGGVRKAMAMDETIDDATGAALKAIQCIESADRGVAVHPRSGDHTYPEFFFQRCTQCKRCTEECPFGALDDDEKGTPKPNPTRCRRCGTCMGACPERIISFKNYNVDMIGSMIKAVDVPDDDEDKLRILALVCENDAYPALDMAGMRHHKISSLVRVIPVRCLGSVNMVWIKDALSSGMDGAILLGCKYGDDYQCHFVKGSEIASRRMENIGETLSTLGLEPERCAVRQVAISDYDSIAGVLNDFVEEIKALGPNPFKGF